MIAVIARPKQDAAAGRSKPRPYKTVISRRGLLEVAEKRRRDAGATGSGCAFGLELFGELEFVVELGGGVVAYPDVEVFGFDYPFAFGGAPELEFVFG
jgi:hypothetical protein